MCININPKHNTERIISKYQIWFLASKQIKVCYFITKCAPSGIHIAGYFAVCYVFLIMSCFDFVNLLLLSSKNGIHLSC